MADRVPHPLVTRAGLELSKQGVTALQEGAKALAQAATEDDKDVLDAVADDDKCTDQKIALADVLANQSDLPEVTLFAGFIGGLVDRDGTKWRVIYLDAELRDWLLVQDDQIVGSVRLDDTNAPYGKRDAIWVKADTRVLRGSGTRAVEGRFLVGEFTRAGDFEVPTTGGTAAAATGVFCEARTASCCRWPSRRG